ncbi:copper transporter [Actinomadura craniellae]|uniref:Copper transporter n=1 Tax=Actinomadura craniellae TaxID=2231787 RepID=A0A365H425_9ACTN|nr:copper transporter [Actinomadura craniellae]RAY13865.1 copper transporter [Actinomadura craniellae]
MIDFRYHLVSIIAIFLSLAVGLVLGATTLRTPVLDQLKSQAGSLARNNDELRARQQEMGDRLKGEDQFARALAAQAVAARLKGESVVFVETPGANDQNLDQVTELAKSAGATVTGRVTVQKKFLDDDQAAVLDQLAAAVKPAELAFPAEATAYDKAGAVLASAIVTNQPARAGREDASGGEILAALKDQGYVTTSGKPGQHATLAVVIAPSTPYQGKGADIDNKALVSLTTELDRAGRGSVLGGPLTAAGEGGLIATLRDAAAAGQVSTVDTVDAASGQVTLILALEGQIKGKTGQYGIGPGAGGYLPTPVPTTGGAG